MGINVEALRQWGSERRIGSDLGYLVHAAARKVFGAVAPQPFYLNQETGTLSGYSVADASVLRLVGEAFAVRQNDDLESLRAIFDMSSVRSRRLPETWCTGERWNFTLLCRPIVRLGNKESDVWLRRNFLEWQEAVAAGTFLGGVREYRALHRCEAFRVYCEWLTEKMSAAVTLENITLLKNEQTSITGRRGKKHCGAPFKTRSELRPSALFCGTLIVRDGSAFSYLIAHGVGRHTAFGYGMLRLRKAD